MNNVSAIINSMSIYSRKDGRYEGRIFLGEGKSKSFYGKTKAELKNKAKEYLHKIENGYKEPQKILLNDYIEYWLKTYKWNKIEPTSYTNKVISIWLYCFCGYVVTTPKTRLTNWVYISTL